MKKPLFVVVGTMVAAAVVAAAILSSGGKSDANAYSLSASRAPGTSPAAALRTAGSAAKHDPQPEVKRPVVKKSGPLPVAEVRELVYGFGRMQVGTKDGEHTFIIRNGGEADLELTAGKATCQCTTFSVERETVPPGEESRVFIRWQAKRKDLMFRHGGDVYTNDPKNPTLNFAVEGAIDEATELLPSTDWDAGIVYRDRPTSFKAFVGSRVFEKFAIESIGAESEFVTIEVQPYEKNPLSSDTWLCGYHILVHVSADIPLGSFSDVVTIKLDCLERELVIPLKARKNGEIRYLPTPGTTFLPDQMLLRLGIFPAAQGASGRIMMIVNHDHLNEPLQLTEIEAKPSWLKASLEPAGSATGVTRRYTLTVEVPPGRPREQHGEDNFATLVMKTNHPTGESIHLDVFFSSN